MLLMRDASTDWLGVVAMRLEGAASSGVNVVVENVVTRCWLVFRMGTQVKKEDAVLPTVKNITSS